MGKRGHLCFFFGVFRGIGFGKVELFGRAVGEMPWLEGGLGWERGSLLGKLPEQWVRQGRLFVFLEYSRGNQVQNS